MKHFSKCTINKSSLLINLENYNINYAISTESPYSS